MFKEKVTMRRNAGRILRHANNFVVDELFIGALVLGAGAAISGSMSSAKASRNARAGAEEQFALADAQYENLAQTAQQWRDRYNEMYAPIEQGLADKVAQGPDYERVAGRVAADVSLAYDKSQAAEERRLQRYGIDPSSGRSTAYRGLDKARSEVMAKNTAYYQENDRDWARKMAFTNMGRGLESAAAGLTGQIAGGYRNMGATYLGQAQSAEQQAGRMAGAAGGMIAGIPRILSSDGTDTDTDTGTVTPPSGGGIPTAQPQQEWT